MKRCPQPAIAIWNFSTAMCIGFMETVRGFGGGRTWFALRLAHEEDFSPYDVLCNGDRAGSRRLPRARRNGADFREVSFNKFDLFQQFVLPGKDHRGAGRNRLQPPVQCVSTTQHQGSLPASAGCGEILTPNVMLSGLKKAEDSDALIVRLYETEGKATMAQIRLDDVLVPSYAVAVETDVLEQPLTSNTARWEGGVLSVRIPAYGLTTVRLG